MGEAVSEAPPGGLQEVRGGQKSQPELSGRRPQRTTQRLGDALETQPDAGQLIKIERLIPTLAYLEGTGPVRSLWSNFLRGMLRLCCWALGLDVFLQMSLALNFFFQAAHSSVSESGLGKFVEHPTWGPRGA